jgi:FkbM family methyltransferase
MSRIIVDVGANEGLFALQQAMENPHHLVIAVEPIPELANALISKALDLNLANLIVKEVAIDTASGIKTLHISDAFSMGTSSLLSFSNPNKLNDYWAQRPDSRQTRSIAMRCTTLEDLISEVLQSTFPLEKSAVIIDFIKIDVQGKDIEVLLSAGKYVSTIIAGMLEAPVVAEESIYEGQENSITEYFSQLKDLNYKVYSLKPNDPGLMEYNLYFHRHGINIGQHIANLSLSGNDIYVGNVNPAFDIEKVIHSYRNSMSWKITLPLRKIRQILIDARLFFYPRKNSNR